MSYITRTVNPVTVDKLTIKDAQDTSKSSKSNSEFKYTEDYQQIQRFNPEPRE